MRIGTRNKRSIFPGRPPRLERIFQCYDPPVFFITKNTWNRRKLLAQPLVHEAFKAYGFKNADQGRCIGRYTIMPDHIHFFASVHRIFRLAIFVQLLEQAITVALQDAGVPGRIWQPGFFDHLLRKDESYAEKWHYVRNNPVRGGLVDHPDEWPYQGEIVRIDRV